MVNCEVICGVGRRGSADAEGGTGRGELARRRDVGPTSRERRSTRSRVRGWGSRSSGRTRGETHVELNLCLNHALDLLGEDSGVGREEAEPAWGGGAGGSARRDEVSVEHWAPTSLFRVERSRGFGRRGTRGTAPEGDALGEESPRRRFADGPDEPRGVRRRGGCEQQRHREDDACPHGPCPTRSESVSHRVRGSPKRGARRAMPSRARLGPRGYSHQPRNLAASLERAVLCLPGRGEASMVVMTRHVFSAPETRPALTDTFTFRKFHPRKLRFLSDPTRRSANQEMLPTVPTRMRE